MSFLNSGVPGFYNAPVSKLIFWTTIVLNAAGALIGSKRGGTRFLGYNAISAKALLFNPLNWWRFITGTFIFSSVGEFFFGMILLYLFRLFERLWGSRKFSVFFVLATLFSFLFQFGAVALLIPVKFIWSGPYGLIFASLAQYLFDIPSVSQFKVLGINMSEKHISVVLALQLLLSGLPNTAIAGIAGFIAGLIYRTDTLRLNQLHNFLPKFIVDFCTRKVYPLVNSSQPNTAQRRRNRRANVQAGLGAQNAGGAPQQDESMQGFTDNLLGDDNPRGGAPGQERYNNVIQQLIQQQQMFMQQQQQGNAGGQQGGAPATAQQVVVSPENVDTLVEMGYDRQTATDALRRTGDDVHAAIEYLLQQM